MQNNTYFNTLFFSVWLQVINKVKFIHQGEGHIKVKVKYLHPFRFYVAHTFCKRVVCIRLNAFLLLTFSMKIYVISLYGCSKHAHLGYPHTVRRSYQHLQGVRTLVLEQYHLGY